MRHKMMLARFAPAGLAGLVLALSLLATAPAAAQDTSGAHWTMTRLNIDVYPDFAAGSFRVEGTARLRLDGVESSAGPTLQLGHDLTPFSDSQTEFAKFAALSANGGPAITLHRAGEARGLVRADIRYARPRRRGQSINIRFETRMVEQSFTAVVTNNVALASARTGWYPTPISPPDADTAHETNAPFDPAPGLTRIHMPAGFYSFSTGEFVSRREGGDTVETWRKHGTRARGFVVGAYERATRRAAGIDVYVYSLTPAMDADAFSEQVGLVADSLIRRYGPFPYPQYAAAEINNEAVRWWGLADGDYQVLRTSLVEIGGVYGLAHEMAHAWWGNLIVGEWPGGYVLSESMAEYSAMIAHGDALGADAFAEALALRQTTPGAPPGYTMPHFFEYLAQGEATALSQLRPGGTDYEIAIVKGARVIHMLRRRVGDDVLFGVMRRLLDTHAHATLSLADLRAAFIAAAPNDDLEQFFAQWLDRSGAPAFETEITCIDGPDQTKINRVTLIQVQTEEPYALDLDLRLTGADQTADAVAQVTGRRTEIDITASECMTEVELNPARDLFIWREEYGNRPG